MSGSRPRKRCRNATTGHSMRSAQKDDLRGESDMPPHRSTIHKTCKQIENSEEFGINPKNFGGTPKNSEELEDRNTFLSGVEGCCGHV